MKAPPELADACANDAYATNRCICGNCSNDAIVNTCLRYTKGLKLGDWILTGCLPSKDCSRVFPEAKADDYVASCPCNGPWSPVSPPSPSSPPAPPNAWSRIKPWLLWGGLAALIVLILWRIRRRPYDPLLASFPPPDAPLPSPPPEVP
jgi:hypothetical protein